jgi:hypothetical protein
MRLRAYIGECRLVPKNSRFPGPNPLPLAQAMDLHGSKTLCQGCINHRYIGGFMQEGGFRTHTVGGGGAGE